jgi:hypothetical protein
MTLRGKICAALVAAAVSAVATVQQAAGRFDEKFDRYISPAVFKRADDFGAWGPAAGPFEPSASPSVAQAATFSLGNRGATVEVGEPTFGGLMTRTVWGSLSLQRASRVVIHTVGSDNFDTDAPADLDTVLAAYRGTSLSTMTLVTANDDRPGYRQGLILFDAAANTPYRIQMGSKASAEGEISANVFVFPPGGGISASLVQYGGIYLEGRDYVCLIGYGGGPSCPSATFVLHNSMGQTLKVYPSNSSGAFLTPAPVTLAPGAIATVNFPSNPSFNRFTPRTLAGHFLFAAYAGSTYVSGAMVRSLTVVKTDEPNELSSGVVQQVRAGRINEGLTFQTWIKNSGSQPATGCHARSNVYTRLKTVWQRFDRSTGATIGVLREPATIPAGQTYWFNVTVASPESRLASPTSNGEILLDCANNGSAPLIDRSRFDLTARGLYDPADIVTTITSPTGTYFINVPVGSYTAFNVSAFNQGSAGTIVALPRYVYPIYTDTNPNARFTTLVCQTASISGACLASATASVQFASPAGSTRTFRVYVRGPAVNPGYNADTRRVFLDFKQNSPIGGSAAPVGTASIAVKRN